MASGAKIATTYVEIKADATQVKPVLDGVRADVTKASVDIGQTAEREIGNGFEAAGRKIEAQTAGVRKLSSAVSSVAGVFTSMLGVITLVSGALLGIIALVRRWTEEQKLTREEAERYSRTLADINAALKERIAIANGNESEAKSLAALQQQRALLRELDDIYKAGALTAEELYEWRIKIVDVFALERDVREKALADAERALQLEKDINAELAKRSSVYDQIRKKADEFAGDQARRRNEEEKEREERRRKEEEDRRERERRDAESARKSAEAMRDAVTNALREVQSQALSINGSTAQSLESLARQVQLIVDNIGIIGGRR